MLHRAFRRALNTILSFPSSHDTQGWATIADEGFATLKVVGILLKLLQLDYLSIYPLARLSASVSRGHSALFQARRMSCVDGVMPRGPHEADVMMTVISVGYIGFSSLSNLRFSCRDLRRSRVGQSRRANWDRDDADAPIPRRFCRTFGVIDYDFAALYFA